MLECAAEKGGTVHACSMLNVCMGWPLVPACGADKALELRRFREVGELSSVPGRSPGLLRRRMNILCTGSSSKCPVWVPRCSVAPLTPTSAKTATANFKQELSL